jgi:uncharacterized membrane protein
MSSGSEHGTVSDTRNEKRGRIMNDGVRQPGNLDRKSTYVFSRNLRGERRVSPPLYKLLLTAHIIASVGWLGIVSAEIALGIAAVRSDVPEVSDALLVSIEVVNVTFLPAAIATIVTGVLLSLGTKWGLLRHYWVVTKLALTVGVIVTTLHFGGRFVRQSVAAPSRPVVDDSTILSLASAPTTLLISLSLAHVLMLGTATVVSVYKPWGKTPFGRSKASKPPREGKAS